MVFQVREPSKWLHFDKGIKRAMTCSRSHDLLAESQSQDSCVLGHYFLRGRHAFSSYTLDGLLLSIHVQGGNVLLLDCSPGPKSSVLLISKHSAFIK